ncbi:UNVERIFIED_CONTAM: hypothetical protein NY100_32310, partial [Prevotella sp. 15_C9]
FFLHRLHCFGRRLSESEDPESQAVNYVNVADFLFLEFAENQRFTNSVSKAYLLPCKSLAFMTQKLSFRDAIAIV